MKKHHWLPNALTILAAGSFGGGVAMAGASRKTIRHSRGDLPGASMTTGSRPTRSRTASGRRHRSCNAPDHIFQNDEQHHDLFIAQPVGIRGIQSRRGFAPAAVIMPRIT